MEILTREGFRDFNSIVLTTISDDNLSIHLSNGKNLLCTKDHKILKDDKFVAAENLEIGDRLSNNIVVDNIENNYNSINMYDVINVKGTNSFFTNGIEVHNCLICDEYGSVPSYLASDFWAANYPTISASKDAKIVVISTPKGLYNMFHQLYVGAERGENTFVPLKFTWREVPGRDQKWADEQLANLGKIKYAQEMECDFIGSMSTVIDKDVLESLFLLTKDPILTEMEGKFRVYEKPEKDALYVIGNDVAKGTGEHYSTTQVLKIISMKPIEMKQVAVFESNTTDIYTFSNIVNRVSIYYNNAYIMVENNAEGAAVVNEIWWGFENENLVNSGGKPTDLGIRATKSTKQKAVILMKRLLEDESLSIIDRETAKQLSSFVEKNNKFFGKNTPDDLVSALYWACYVFEMGYFEEGYELKKEEEENDVWGILTDMEQETNDFDFLDSGIKLWG